MHDTRLPCGWGRVAGCPRNRVGQQRGAQASPHEPVDRRVQRRPQRRVRGPCPGGERYPRHRSSKVLEPAKVDAEQRRAPPRLLGPGLRIVDHARQDTAPAREVACERRHVTQVPDGSPASRRPRFVIGNCPHVAARCQHHDRHGPGTGPDGVPPLGRGAAQHRRDQGRRSCGGQEQRRGTWLAVNRRRYRERMEPGFPPARTQCLRTQCLRTHCLRIQCFEPNHLPGEYVRTLVRAVAVGGQRGRDVRRGHTASRPAGSAKPPTRSTSDLVRPRIRGICGGRLFLAGGPPPAPAAARRRRPSPRRQSTASSEPAGGGPAANDRLPGNEMTARDVSVPKVAILRSRRVRRRRAPGGGRAGGVGRGGRQLTASRQAGGPGGQATACRERNDPPGDVLFQSRHSAKVSARAPSAAAGGVGRRRGRQLSSEPSGGWARRPVTRRPGTKRPPGDVLFPKSRPCRVEARGGGGRRAASAVAGHSSRAPAAA